MRVEYWLFFSLLTNTRVEYWLCFCELLTSMKFIFKLNNCLLLWFGSLSWIQEVTLLRSVALRSTARAPCTCTAYGIGQVFVLIILLCVKSSLKVGVGMSSFYVLAFHTFQWLILLVKYINTVLMRICSFCQAAAAAQAGASVIQIFVGRLRVTHSRINLCSIWT